jgi:hypothetical protein
MNHPRQVPDQVAVLVVDNDKYLCDLSLPSLSGIDVNSEETGYQGNLCDAWPELRIQSRRSSLVWDPLLDLRPLFLLLSGFHRRIVIGIQVHHLSPDLFAPGVEFTAEFSQLRGFGDGEVF